ncbi:hypothetical protein M0805_004395 [Coniferiporia weirii]|nr:hypothetical protein M0805_004395 [Coniferiporia weirii]
MKNAYLFSLLSGLFSLFGAALFAIAEDDPTFPNTVYLIRNAETDTGESNLSVNGSLRADCLTSVFGAQSNRTIGYIIADAPKKNGKGTEMVDTVTPLAASLGLTIDTSCSADDKDCIGDAAQAFAAHSGAGILICSVRTYLPDIAEVLGVNDVPSWSKKRFDLVWTVIKNKLVSKTSEGCPGLDD